MQRVLLRCGEKPCWLKVFYWAIRSAIASYLISVIAEADRRGYNFNRSKIINKEIKSKIPVTNGQVEYEFKHLLEKLIMRDPDLYNQLKTVKRIKVNPTFKKVPGKVEDWERI
jgi:hypothetical protein